MLLISFKLQSKFHSLKGVKEVHLFHCLRAYALWCPFLFSGATRIVAANNDAKIRIYDAKTFTCLNGFMFRWSVNVSDANSNVVKRLMIHYLLSFSS